MTFSSDDRVQTFAPRKDAMKSAMFQFLTFLFFVLLGLSMTLFSGEKPAGLLSTRVLGPVAIVFFGLLAYHGWTRVRAARIAYAIDNEGVSVVGQRENLVRWEQIADVRFVHPMGIDELRVDLVDAAGKTLLAIPTEPLVRGGQTLVAELFLRLRQPIERTAREYLRGEKKWSMGLLKDAVRIEGDMLFINFPAGKKQAVPIRSLTRVEWVPGSVSGAKKGYVLIEHPGGRVELPQILGGIQYFLFSLKYLLGLGERVNPSAPEQVSQKVDAVRSAQLWVVLGRTTGIALMICSVILFGKVFMRYLDEQAAMKMGVPAEAEVVEKSANGVKFRYIDQAGKQHETWSRVEEKVHRALQPGTRRDIRVHPANPSAIWFAGKDMLTWTGQLVFGGSCLAVLIGGIFLTVFSSRKAKRDQERIRQIESAAPPPLPVATGFAPPPPPPPPPPPFASMTHSPVESSPARTCTSCNASIIGSYYLADGKPYCAGCREKSSGVLNKPGKRILLKALVFGAAGGILAGAIWATATLLTGYELGIVAILVGYIVGFSVKRAARGYSGRSLQVCAMVLTLFALSYAIIPILVITVKNDPALWEQVNSALNQRMDQAEAEDVWAGTEEEWSEEEDAETYAGTIPGRALDTASTVSLVSAEDFTADADAGDQSSLYPSQESAITAEEGLTRLVSQETPGMTLLTSADGTSFSMTTTDTEAIARIMAQAEAIKPPESLGWVLAKLGGILLLGLVLLFFAPVIVYFIVLFSSPLSGLFLLVALWEAWRINRPEKKVFSGPFQDQGTLSFDKAEYTQP